MTASDFQVSNMASSLSMFLEEIVLEAVASIGLVFVFLKYQIFLMICCC